MIATIVLCMAPGLAAANCDFPEFSGGAPQFVDASPTLTLARPERPDCLPSPDTPQAQNCSEDVIDAYAAEVEAYVAALNAFVNQTQTFANAAVGFANAAVAFAEGSQAHADAVWAFANCEAGEIRGP